jgi:hypothetical protein
MWGGGQIDVVCKLGESALLFARERLPVDAAGLRPVVAASYGVPLVRRAGCRAGATTPTPHEAMKGSRMNSG